MKSLWKYIVISALSRNKSIMYYFSGSSWTSWTQKAAWADIGCTETIVGRVKPPMESSVPAPRHSDRVTIQITMNLAEIICLMPLTSIYYKENKERSTIV